MLKKSRNSTYSSVLNLPVQNFFKFMVRRTFILLVLNTLPFAIERQSNKYTKLTIKHVYVVELMRGENLSRTFELHMKTEIELNLC